jgi:hypothetical protein
MLKDGDEKTQRKDAKYAKNKKMPLKILFYSVAMKHFAVDF